MTLVVILRRVLYVSDQFAKVFYIQLVCIANVLLLSLIVWKWRLLWLWEYESSSSNFLRVWSLGMVLISISGISNTACETQGVR